jgi:hypothetical protein
MPLREWGKYLEGTCKTFIKDGKNIKVSRHMKRNKKKYIEALDILRYSGHSIMRLIDSEKKRSRK